MGHIPRVDRKDEGRVDKQANIGLQPSTAKIAGTKHPAIGTGIVRRRQPARTDSARRTEHQPTEADLFQPIARVQRSGWDNRSHLASACHGLCDFSPEPANLGHATAVQRHPGILGQRIFVGVAQRLMGGDAVLIAAGDLVALLVGEELLDLSVC